LTPPLSIVTVLIWPAPCTTESDAAENMFFARPSVLTPVLTPVFALYHQSFCTSASTADTDTTGGTTYPLPADVSAIVLIVPYVAGARTTIVFTVAVGYVAKVLAAMAVTMGV
jgi:hypothetical protein